MAGTLSASGMLFGTFASGSVGEGATLSTSLAGTWPKTIIAVENVNAVKKICFMG
jgi:hypothetical protein